MSTVTSIDTSEIKPGNIYELWEDRKHYIIFLERVCTDHPVVNTFYLCGPTLSYVAGEDPRSSKFWEPHLSNRLNVSANSHGHRLFDISGGTRREIFPFKTVELPFQVGDTVHIINKNSVEHCDVIMKVKRVKIDDNAIFIGGDSLDLLKNKILPDDYRVFSNSCVDFYKVDLKSL